MRDSGVIALLEGSVDFGRYPDAALLDVASKRRYAGDRIVIISKLRTQLLLGKHSFVKGVLRDLHDAAVRHGAADDVVVLTPVPR